MHTPRSTSSKARGFPAAIACLALICVSCSSTNSVSAHETRISRLVVEEITLVDSLGKPWLRIGPRDSGGFQGMEFFDDDGEVALRMGIEHPPVRTPAEAEEARALGEAFRSWPVIHLESPGGEGIASLFCHDAGAGLQ